MTKKPGYINPRVHRMAILKKKKEIGRRDKIIENLQKLTERQAKEILRLKGMLSDYGLL